MWIKYLNNPDPIQTSAPRNAHEKSQFAPKSSPISARIILDT